MASMNPVSSCLSLTELGDAVTAISDEGWIRLRKVATIYSYGQISPDDLLQEALLGALEGRRKCPHNVDVIRFLALVMRSLASSNFKSMKRKPEEKTISIDRIGDELSYDPPTDEPNAEQKIVSNQGVVSIKASILELFEDDEIAQVIIEGDMEGIDASELLDLTGLDKKGYASKRRLIRRRIERAYPEGWK